MTDPDLPDPTLIARPSEQPYFIEFKSSHLIWFWADKSSISSTWNFCLVPLRNLPLTQAIEKYDPAGKTLIPV